MLCKTGKFTLLEQVWMQLSFNGVWILGAVAIYPNSPSLAFLYIAGFPIFGILYCVMHLWICPRCPHIKEHSACVQLPPFLAKRIIGKNVSGSLNLLEKTGFFVILYGLFVFPLFWIVRQPYLILPYLGLGLMHYLAYYFHFCPKCLNRACPQNMNP